MQDIPDAVYSYHAEKLMLAEGVSQHLRNQKPDGIPALYAFAQMLLSISGQDGKYATTETPAKFWSLWREEEIPAATIEPMRPSSSAS